MHQKRSPDTACLRRDRRQRRLGRARSPVRVLSANQCAARRRAGLGGNEASAFAPRLRRIHFPSRLKLGFRLEPELDVPAARSARFIPDLIGCGTDHGWINLGRSTCNCAFHNVMHLDCEFVRARRTKGKACLALESLALVQKFRENGVLAEWSVHLPAFALRARAGRPAALASLGG